MGPSWQNAAFFTRSRADRNPSANSGDHGHRRARRLPRPLRRRSTGSSRPSGWRSPRPRRSGATSPARRSCSRTGRPSEHLFVVREGSVELVHEGEVVDVLGPGESFGHPSLLSGLAPAFTVRAREQTVVLPDPARGGARGVHRTGRRRLPRRDAPAAPGADRPRRPRAARARDDPGRRADQPAAGLLRGVA